MPSRHFSEVTENNHAGVIWIISLLGLVYTVLTFVTRGLIKWHMLGPDDFVLVAAQAFAFGQYGALFASLRDGLGRTSEMLTEPSRAMVSKTAFTSQLLLIVALGLSKCSVVFLIRRVFTRDMKHFWFICNTLLVTVCVWAVASIVIVSAGCNTAIYVPPRGDATCVGFNSRWIAVIALDVITELIVVVLPVYFLWPLQMAVRLKARVVLAFAFRLPIVAFAVIFLYTFTTVPPGANQGVAISTAIIWQQLHVSYSLISATIPCLKSFISSFDTNFGMGDGSSEGQYNYSSGHTGSQTNSRSHSDLQYQSKSSPSRDKVTHESIKLQSLKPKKSATFFRESELSDEPNKKRFHVGRLRPERLKSSTTISGGKKEDERPESKGSDGRSSLAGSQELIIRRDVQFEIRSDVRSDYAGHAASEGEWPMKEGDKT